MDRASLRPGTLYGRTLIAGHTLDATAFQLPRQTRAPGRDHRCRDRGERATHSPVVILRPFRSATLVGPAAPAGGKIDGPVDPDVARSISDDLEHHSRDCG